MPPYVQTLDPFGHRLLSTAVAALPVLALFYLLVGRRWLASLAGAGGAVVALLVATLAYGMPAPMAAMAFVHGAVFGLVPIGWTVFGAMLIYNLTVETGQFAVIRRSIGGLSGDARVQSILVGFCFGAFMEGSAGTGIPVAICGAMLVGLGVPAFRAAVLCLIANTSPVCFGGLGVPVLTLGSVTGIPAETVSVMCAHQLPFLSCLVPLYMVKCICSWRDTFAVWPALAVGGGSFAVFQYLFATMHTWIPGVSVWPLTDIGGGLFSLVILALFLKFVWKPEREWRFPAEAPPPPAPENHPLAEQPLIEVADLMESPEALKRAPVELTNLTVFKAWSPFLIMACCLAVAGAIRQAESARGRAVLLAGVPSYFEAPVPELHKQVERAERLQKPGATDDEKREAAVFKFVWSTAPGTACTVAAILAALALRASPAVCGAVLRRTVRQMAVPIPTIACMLGLSYVTKYAGIDATLGVAFAETGVFYPFFAAYLGWLGVFLTGTDAGSNALFGSLQKITAGQVHGTGVLPALSLDQAEVLISTANSTGGVMGKMIDAQSICVATAGTDQVGREADLFRAVFWHSVFLAGVVGAMTAMQAFVPPFTAMVPGYGAGK